MECPFLLGASQHLDGHFLVYYISDLDTKGCTVGNRGTMINLIYFNF